MRKIRQSNFELLRIISMILIIAHHFSVHGGFSFPIGDLSVNKLFMLFLQLGGKIGVNIFILISGYFLILQLNINLKKVFNLWCDIVLYSIVIYFLSIFIGSNEFNIRSFLKVIVPISNGEWWFASTYFVLYLLSPFINKLLLSLSHIEYKRLVILITLIWCIIPTFLNKSFQSNNLIWFIYLYIIAGYIRIFKDEYKLNIKKYGFLLPILYFLTYISAIIIDILSKKYTSLSLYITHYFGMQQLPILLIAILFFMIFKPYSFKNKYINIIASATFGVYLIHDSNFFKYYLWTVIFKNATYTNSKYLIFYSILVISIVFIVCTVVELIRINVTKNYINKIYDTIYSLIEKNIKVLYHRKVFNILLI